MHYAVINDSWFLILKINGYLTTSFYKFHMLEKRKLMKTNSQTDQVRWVCEVKSYKNGNLKKKILYFKVLHFKVSAVY